MATLFAFGTIWFWFLITAVLVTIISITELEESSSWHWPILLGIPTLLYFTGCADEINSIINYAKDNPLAIILILGGYLLVGTLWSFIKWFLYLTNLTEYYRKYPYNFSSAKDKFNARENKERIINWMMYWPLSGIWTLIDDPVKKAFQKIFSGLENRFQKISDNLTEEFTEKGSEEFDKRG